MRCAFFIATTAMLGLGCTAAKSGGADQAQSKKSIGGKDTDEFGYLNYRKFLGYGESDTLLFEPVLASSLPRTPAAESYVLSMTLDSQPREVGDINIAIFRPNTESCEDFAAALENDSFTDLTVHRYFLHTSFDHVTYDNLTNSLQWIVSAADTNTACAVVVAADDLPEDAVSIGYRPQYGAVSFALAREHASAQWVGDSNLIFASTESGSFAESLIARTTLGSEVSLAALPNKSGYMVGGYGEVFERRSGTAWSAKVLPVADGQASDAINIYFDTSGGGEKTYVLRGYEGGNPAVRLDVRDSPGKNFTYVGGRRPRQIFGASNIVENSIAFFDIFYDGTIYLYGAVASLDVELYGFGPLRRSTLSGDQCADVSSTGSAIALAPNGDTYFAYPCKIGAQAPGSYSLVVGTRRPMPGVSGSQEVILQEFHPPEGTNAADISRVSPPTIVFGRNGEAHFLFRSVETKNELRFYLATLDADDELSTREIRVETNPAASNMRSGSTLSAAIDADRGVLHIAFSALNDDVATPFYGMYVLGADSMRATSLPNTTNSLDLTLMSPMIIQQR